MLKKLIPLLVLLLLIFFTWFLFYTSMPRSVETKDVTEKEFSTLRAFDHVKNMSLQPHYVGSSAHSKVRNYIVNELQEIGLEVQTQEAYVLNKYGEISLARNILARIPGSGEGNSLVLMSHYDSAGHSSYGASDAGSGVATILEGIRAFLSSGETHENDIVILITDAEEIGLLGAQLYVEKHPWAQKTGLALNFESRGSGGNSIMLLETNQGNAGLIRGFKQANPRFPVTNSLAYSVYKMLPNDTDLTVLREKGNINGFNFAFIDDHYDYHTANDIPANLDKETLAHQGSYLMPLLNYYKDANLVSSGIEEDLLYFNVPGGKLITYPFSWIIPLLVLAFALFFGVVIFGLYKKRIAAKAILKGSIPFFISVLGSGLLAYFLWQFCLMIYPEYGEMQQGFTYNGYWYIAAFIFLALTLNLMIYHQFNSLGKQAAYFVFPLFFWMILCILMAVFLPGAAYFIIPAYFSIIQLYFMIWQQLPNRFLMLFLSLPALIILLPFITTFPVALGLKILFVAAILTSFLFSLFLPVLGYFKMKKALGLLCFLVFNILFITAHFKSSFTEDRQKPNSLVYLLDIDMGEATWNSFDNLIDSWTETFFGENPQILNNTNDTFASKYKSGFTFKTAAPVISIAQPGILIRQLGNDSLKNTVRYSLKIAPNRKVNRLELFVDRAVNFKEFKVNNLEADSIQLGQEAFHVFTKRWNDRLLTYHAANSDTLSLEFVVAKDTRPEFTLFEVSYDLLENEQLNVRERESTMIPRPFVVNDAVILKKTIKIN